MNKEEETLLPHRPGSPPLLRDAELEIHLQQAPACHLPLQLPSVSHLSEIFLNIPSAPGVSRYMDVRYNGLTMIWQTSYSTYVLCISSLKLKVFMEILKIDITSNIKV